MQTLGEGNSSFILTYIGHEDTFDDPLTKFKASNRINCSSCEAKTNSAKGLSSPKMYGLFSLPSKAIKSLANRSVCYNWK